MKKLIVCSVPKSGTYFLGQILTQLGMRDTKLHIHLRTMTDYNGADLEKARKQASEFSVPEPIASSLQRIGPGEFAVGHLPISTAPLLRDFAVIFVYRNVRDILVSFARWVANTGRWPDEGKWRQLPDGPDKLLGFLKYHHRQVRGVLDNTAAWRTQPSAAQISFEELMGDHGSDAAASAMRRIARAAGCNESPDEVLLDLLQKARETETITRSGSRSVSEVFWNERVEQEFVRRGFAAINVRLGFAEPSESGWGGRWRTLKRAARTVRLRRAA